MESRSIETWQALMDLPELQAKAATTNPRDVAAVGQLRKSHDLPIVSAALELAAGRSRLANKAWLRTPTSDAMPITDSEGAEQATHRAVALHKAAWFANVAKPDTKIFDLCCGIGADAMAISEAGLNVTVVDHDPLRAWLAAANASCESITGDVADAPIDGALIHIDPSRRIEGKGREATKRNWKLEDYQPAPAAIADFLHRAAGGAVALGPGLDIASIDLLTGSDLTAAVQVFSLGGRLVQAVLWTGDLVPEAFRVEPPRIALVATRIDEAALQGDDKSAMARITASASHIAKACTPDDPMSVRSSVPTLSDPLAYVYTMDPAIERLGLVGKLSKELDAPAAAHYEIGLLTSSERIDSDWLTPFKLIEVMPWRAKKVKRWLREHDGGIVEVKTRGKACDPDVAQKQLRGDGQTPYVVFVLRMDHQLQAWIATRG